MHPTVRGVLPGVGTAVLCALALATSGIGLALCLLALALLAAALQVWVPCLSGPVRWAAAAILFTAYSIGSSWLPTLVSIAPLTQNVALVVLALPSIVCTGMLVWARRRSRREMCTDASLGRGVTLIVSLGVILVPVLARVQGGSSGLVWGMSGDNRNNIQSVRAIIEAGGLTLSQLRGYTSGINGLTALNAVAHGRDDLTRAQLLETDVASLAGSWILAAIAIGVLSSAAVILSLPTELRNARRLSAPVAAVAVGAGFLVGTGLFAGVALRDGFLSALAGEALLLAGVVVAIQALRSPHLVLALLILVDVAVLLAYRPLLAFVVLLFVPMVVLQARRLGEWHRGWWFPAALAAAFAAFLGIYTFTAGRHSLRLALETPGAITAPSIWLFAALLLLSVALTFDPHSVGHRTAGLPTLVVMGSIAAMIAVAEVRFPQPGLLSYSSAKLVWAGCMVGAWVVFAHIARAVAQPDRGDRSASPRAFVRATALSAAALIGVAVSSPLPGPLPSMVKNQWINPNSEVIDALLADLDEGPVVVPWAYAPSFADDKLGIFWSMTQWDPPLFEQFFNWSYALTDGDATTMCPLVQVVPRLVVLTHDDDLERRVHNACGAAGSKVRFIVEAKPPASVIPRAAAPAGAS